MDANERATGESLAPALRSAGVSKPVRWLLAGFRVLLIVTAAWGLNQIPLPILDHWLPVKNVVIAVIAVTLIGKTLYDTLFYERFWP